MIKIKAMPDGSVAVRVETAQDRAKVRSLKYLKHGRNYSVTWWTYLPDLKRDLGTRAKWDIGIKPIMQQRVSQLAEYCKGDDAWVNTLFAENRKPYPFQMEGIHFGLNRERVLLADDTGLGKTIQTIGIMLGAFDRQDIQRAVLVVPAGLKMQWHDQIYEFGHEDCIPEGVLMISSGLKRDQRRLLYLRPWRVLIINPALLRRDYDFLKKAKGIDFAAIDEASCIKNAGTDTSEIINGLFGGARYKLALTATPIENGLVDLFHIFNFIDPKVFIDQSYFNKRYIQWKTRKMRVRRRNGQAFTVKKKEVLRYRNLAEVRQKIRPRYIRRRVKDVGLQLPDLIIRTELVPLPPKQMAVYRALRAEKKDELKNLRGGALIAPTQGLRQVCDSTELVTKIKKGKPAQAKVERIKELLNTDLAGEQVIIFTDFERFVRIMQRELRPFGCVSYTGDPKQKKNRQRAIDAFVCGDARILLATKAGERGHNLQNASVVINADLPWNPAALKQRLGRVRRLGSEHQSVRMINLVGAGTLEENLIMKKIYSKRQVFEDVFGEDELNENEYIERISAKDLWRLL